MKTLSYIDQNFTEKEVELFCENIKSSRPGIPHKWLGCNEDGMLVECESCIAYLTWEETQKCLTISTYREVKLWCNDASEILSKYIYIND